jgi:ABC-type uncharacterized transport system ATPase component
MVTHDLLDAVATGHRVEALIAGRLDRQWLQSRLASLAREVAGLLPPAAAALSPAHPL